MSTYVDLIRGAFAAQAGGDLEPSRELLGTDAVLNLPSFIPGPEHKGFHGLVALVLEMASRCDGGFTSTFLEAIGAGRIVTA